MAMKYHNVKKNVDGHVFASIAEARRYQELILQEKAGVIHDLRLQPEYELIPRFNKGKRTFRKTVYIADFEYKEGDMTIIEDVKGTKTDVYRLKKKMFEYKYPELTIREIKMGRKKK